MSSMRWIVSFFVFGVCAGWCGAPADSPKEQLYKLFDEEWAFYLEAQPEFGSSMGRRDLDHLWNDESLDAYRQRYETRKAFLKRLEAINPSELSEEDQLNYKLFHYRLTSRIERYPYGWHLIPLNQRGGIQTQDNIINQLPFKTKADYDAWCKRLEAFPVLMDQTIALMREGMKRGLLLPKVVMKRVPPQIDAQIHEDPTKSRFYRPFRRLPADLARYGFRVKGKDLVAEHVIPAYRKFKTFFEQEYLPACYDKVGIWQIEGGKKLYAFRARQNTTTNLTPEEIHEIGQKEVSRIRTEMERIIARVKFEGDFAEFLHFLRTDPQFYYDTPEALFQAYEALSKRIDPTLVKLFDKMPRMPYGVEKIPDNFAADTTTAYYQPPNPDGTRAGTYFVNLYQPETRPKYEMEALSLHEAVPGHHFQIALSQELESLPNFRRYHNSTVYAEGWALYAESLGEELGFYKDPYSKFGQLTYEMWRAVRLVVDTGIHYMGWTREQAITFFKNNAAKSEHDIVNEIDRYIAWPGQALGYKIGELKIKELRKRAEDKLGDNFDIRAFHNTILTQGSLPLNLLEERVDNWIAEGGKR